MNTILYNVGAVISQEFLSCFSTLSLDAQIIDQKLPLELRTFRRLECLSAVELSSFQLLDFLQILSEFIRKIGPQLKAIELHSNYDETGPQYHGVTFSDDFFRIVSVVLLYGSLNGYLDGVKRLKVGILCDSHCYYLFGNCVYDPEKEARTGWTAGPNQTMEQRRWEEEEANETPLPRYITTGRARSSRPMGLVRRGPWETWVGERKEVPLIKRLEVLEIPEDIF